MPVGNSKHKNSGGGKVKKAKKLQLWKIKVHRFASTDSTERQKAEQDGIGWPPGTTNIPLFC